METKQKTMRKVLLLLIVSVWIGVGLEQRKYHSVEYTHVGSPINRYDISNDGKIIMFTDTNFHLHKIINDGVSLTHTLDIDCTPYQIHNGRVLKMNQNGSQAMIVGINSCTTLQIGTNNYSVKWSLAYPNRGAVPFEGLKTIYIQNATSPYPVDFFQFNGTDMVLTETIEKGDQFYSKRMGKNPKSLIFFTIVTPAVLRVIIQINGVFQQFQLLTHPSMKNVSKVLTTQNSFDTIGFIENDQMVLYHYNRIQNQFQLKGSYFLLPGVAINNVWLGPQAKLIQIAFEGISSFQTFQYNQNTDSYFLVEEMIITQPHEVRLINGNYWLLVDKTLGKIFLISVCQKGCQICDTFRVCSQCQEGYTMEQDKSCRKIDFCFNYMAYPLNQICHIPCSKECLTCGEKQNFCLSCKNPFILKENQGKCKLPQMLDLTAYAYSILNIVRATKARSFFLLIQDLQLYQYHQIRYEGNFKNVISYTEQLQERAWSLFPFGQWVQSPFSFMPNYIPYSNQRAVEMDRKDSLFFQNLKSYFSIFIPFTILLFFVLNRIFYCLFQKPQSIIFRNFSFPLYVLELIVVNNLSDIWFFGIRNFFMLFSQVFWFKALQCLFIVIFFIGILIGFVILFFYEFQYEWLSKYFLPNMKKMKSYLFATFSLYIIKPIMLSCIHFVCFSSPTLQLSLLSAVYLMSGLIMATCQIKHQIFEYKCLFCLQLIVNLLMGVFNIVLIFNYILSETKDLDSMIDYILWLLAIASTLLWISVIFIIILDIIKANNLQNSQDLDRNQQESSEITRGKQGQKREEKREEKRGQKREEKDRKQEKKNKIIFQIRGIEEQQYPPYPQILNQLSNQMRRIAGVGNKIRKNRKNQQ